MSMMRSQPPIFRIECDADGCEMYWENPHVNTPGQTRMAAEREGWRVRPGRGPGSRTGPEYCPDHADEAEAA